MEGSDSPVPLFHVALMAPLIGYGGQPAKFHAVTMEDVIAAWSKESASAACGADGLKLLANRDRQVLPWPPRVAGLTVPRCRDCHRLTGKMRPRSQVAR